MNLRIRELAEQANFTEQDIEDMSPGFKKFAELIVRECAALTLDHRSDDYYQGWLDYRDEIQRHFGVES